LFKFQFRRTISVFALPGAAPFSSQKGARHSPTHHPLTHSRTSPWPQASACGTGIRACARARFSGVRVEPFPHRHRHQHPSHRNVTPRFASQTSARAFAAASYPQIKKPAPRILTLRCVPRANSLHYLKFLHSHGFPYASILYPLSARPRSSCAISFCLSVTHSGTSLPSCIRAYST